MMLVQELGIGTEAYVVLHLCPDGSHHAFGPFPDEGDAREWHRSMRAVGAFGTEERETFHFIPLYLIRPMASLGAPVTAEEYAADHAAERDRLN